MDFLQGYFVADINQIFAILEKNLNTSEKKSRLCGIVFAHQKNEFAKSKIIPFVEYWNYRSKEYVDFFFLGYLGDENINECEFTDVPPEEIFSEKHFNQALDYFEKNSTWKYSGQPTMLLCRGYKNDIGQTKLDLRSMIEIDFIRAEKQGLIESVESFFEEIIRVSQKHEFVKIDFDFKKNIYGKPLAKSLIKTIFENLPIDFSGLFNTASAIKIISSP